jgi:hypothetical protein
VAGQTFPHAPQLFLSFSRRTQELLQFVVPLSHWQFPLMQVEGPLQAWAHAPQLASSEFGFTQSPEHTR